jgi:hypothetical protein
MVRNWLRKKERYYYPLSVVPEVDYIIGFVLNCSEFVGLSYDDMLVIFPTLASVNIQLRKFPTLMLVNIT